MNSFSKFPFTPLNKFIFSSKEKEIKSSSECPSKNLNSLSSVSDNDKEVGELHDINFCFFNFVTLLPELLSSYIAYKKSTSLKILTVSLNDLMKLD